MTTYNYVIPVWIRLPKNRKVKPSMSVSTKRVLSRRQRPSTDVRISCVLYIAYIYLLLDQGRMQDFSGGGGPNFKNFGILDIHAASSEAASFC